MIYCCKEHVEMALDEVVDKYEVAPVMKELTEKERLSTTCAYCQEQAIYVVAN